MAKHLAKEVTRKKDSKFRQNQKHRVVTESVCFAMTLYILHKSSPFLGILFFRCLKDM